MGVWDKWSENAEELDGESLIINRGVKILRSQSYQLLDEWRFDQEEEPEELHEEVFCPYYYGLL